MYCVESLFQVDKSEADMLRADKLPADKLQTGKFWADMLDIYHF